jgi:cbb3-type cytochrome oxidase subunit 3
MTQTLILILLLIAVGWWLLANGVSGGVILLVSSVLSVMYLIGFNVGFVTGMFDERKRHPAKEDTY